MTTALNAKPGSRKRWNQLDVVVLTVDSAGRLGDDAGRGNFHRALAFDAARRAVEREQQHGRARGDAAEQREILGVAHMAPQPADEAGGLVAGADREEPDRD